VDVAEDRVCGRGDPVYTWTGIWKNGRRDRQFEEGVDGSDVLCVLCRVLMFDVLTLPCSSDQIGKFG
jgi:hypothetical protein